MLDSSTPPGEAEGEGYAPPPPGRRMKVATQGLILVIFALVLATVFFVAPAIIGLAAPSDASADATPQAVFTPTKEQWAGLRIQRIVPQDMAPFIQADGRIALDDDLSTPVVSPYSGRVIRIMARAGDRVVAGAPLFSVLSPELAQAENDMVSALSALRTARAQLDLTAVNERRQHDLFVGHGAALKDWQQSRVDLATAQGGWRSAQIAVSAVRSRLAILGMNASEIHAVETSADLEHESADTVVRAPIAGTITQRQISLGQNIVGLVTSQGSAGAVFTIGNLRRLWMVANAREADAPAFHVGDAARVSVPAYPGRIFDGRVSYVSPIIDPATHRLLVRMDVENPDGALKPDMLAQFEIATGAAAPMLAVPDRAVVYEGADAHVWVADPAHHTLALRQIEVGAVNHGMVEILHGMTAGEYVVTSGAVFIDRALSAS